MVSFTEIKDILCQFSREYSLCNEYSKNSGTYSSCVLHYVGMLIEFKKLLCENGKKNNRCVTFIDKKNLEKSLELLPNIMSGCHSNKFDIKPTQKIELNILDKELTEAIRLSSLDNASNNPKVVVPSRAKILRFKKDIVRLISCGKEYSLTRETCIELIHLYWLFNTSPVQEIADIYFQEYDVENPIFNTFNHAEEEIAALCECIE